ncbi:MAG: discoidin domain-containing protein, partial [Chitinophagaceae bacterium]
GTEGGSVGETNWSLLNATGDVPYNMLHYGLENGDSWVPGEVNTSIRPGWFYHTYEDSRVKKLPQLLNTYYSSFGRNGTLLLNFPIDRHGLIHENDKIEALQLAKTVKEIFAVNLAEKKKATASNVRGNAKECGADKLLDADKNTYWATDDNVNSASVVIDLGKPTTFNRFLAQEYIRLGQRVKSFKIEVLVNGEWKELAQGTTIGYKRILLFPTVKASQVRFTIIDSKSSPVISNAGIYYAPQVLMAPAITRNKAGEVSISTADKESIIYYSLDGSAPTRKSKRYTGPVQTNGKIEMRAVAYDSLSGKSSLVSGEKFDIVHKDWKIIGIDNTKVDDIIDGNPATAVSQPQDKKMPVDIVIDLGNEENLSGFRYLPDQNRVNGIITNYQFYVSHDNEQWKLADEGEFSNIKNNPLWQIKKFEPVKARYIKLRALKNTQDNNEVGYAELDVVTQ